MSRVDFKSVFVFVCILWLALAASAQDDEVWTSAKKDSAIVYFVHGIPGSLGNPDNAVEVWVDDEILIDNVKYGQFFGPMSIKAGTYQVKSYEAGFGPDKGFSPVAERSVTYIANQAVLVVGHLTEDGKNFTNSDFPLDFSPILNKKNSRVFVFHCAAYSHLVASFYNWSDSEEHPYVGHEAMLNTDKFVAEITRALNWGFYVQEGKDNGRLLYDKAFKPRAQKGHMVVIIGVPNTPTFKVLFKTHKKKLK